MDVKELDDIIESTISKEIRNTIISEAIGEKYEVYHVMHKGEPIESFKTEDEAEKYKNEHPDQELLIDKQVYESYSDMIEKLDQMGQQLEEKEKTNMENTTPKFKTLAEAIQHAKETGHKKVKIKNEVYDVNETWQKLVDEEGECEECWGKSMEEDLTGNQDKIDANHDGEISGDDFAILRGDKEEDMEEGDGYHLTSEEDMSEEEHIKHFKSKVAQRLEKELGREPSRDELIKAITDELSKQIAQDEKLMDTHKQVTDEIYDEEGADIETGHSDGTNFEEILRGSKKEHGDYNDPKYLDSIGYDDRIEEEKSCCNECGGMINEEGMCNECGAPYQQMEESTCPKCGKEVCECGSGMYESKKKKIRLTETELIELINKMVNESMPGYEAYKKAHGESGKQNNKEVADMVADVTKNHIKVDGIDSVEFPHQNDKGDKVVVKNTDAENEEIDDNRGRNPFDLTYDIEPSKQFKDRLKKAIEGHSTMGNAPVTEPNKINPSNGAEKGEDSENKEGNVIPTPETGKKFEKDSKKRIEIKKKEPRYAKEPAPVKHVNESKTFQMSELINEDILKMKTLLSYNKKTQ